MTGLFLLCSSAGAAPALPAFSAPVFHSGSANGCSADKVVYVLAPDNSVISIERRNNYLLVTPRDSKARIKALCRFDLVLTQPPPEGAILQIDVRGADNKLALSELELKVSFGASHHKVFYPRGQVLDGSANDRRFQLTDLPADRSKVRLEIEARARSLNGKDLVQVSIDTFDACFVTIDGSTACTTLAPPPAEQPATK